MASGCSLGRRRPVFRRRNRDAQYLEEQVEQGRLLVFVRMGDTAEVERAKGILSKHAPLEVRMVSLSKDGRS